MEKKQETKKTKSLTQKAKKIRSIIMMTLLCVLMMSAATYAWFTLSNTAKATNLTMTVGKTSGLQIAPDDNGNAGTFGSSIAFEPVDGKLLPTTTTDADITTGKFKVPHYDGNGAVDGFESEAATGFVGVTVNSNSAPEPEKNQDGYYIMYTFWLKSLGSTSTVKLSLGTGLDAADGIYDSTKSYGGTYVLTKKANDSETNVVPSSAAVRLCFIPGNQALDSIKAIYEPNSDLKKETYSLTAGTDFANTTGSAENLSSIASTIKHKANGSVDGNVDGNVISLDADKATKVTLYVWIEGTDDLCANQIAAKDIIGQLEFTNK